MTSTPTLVGLIGRKGSGKDTAAAALLSEGYQNVKFAGALKDMIRCLLAYQGVDSDTIERMVEGDLKEAPTPHLAGRTPRYAMQTLGTEWGRDLIGEDFWTAVTMARVGDRKTVITDVRFPNEVQSVEAAGGFPFGISADWIKPVAGEHESERLIDDLIAALPEGQKIVNRKAASDAVLAAAIETFRQRFMKKLAALSEGEQIQ